MSEVQWAGSLPGVGTLLRLAAWTFENRVLAAAHIACIGLLFVPSGDSLSRSVALPILLVLAGLGLLSPGRHCVTRSNVLLACAAYLLVMTLASLAAGDAAPEQVWRQFRISVLIVAFLAITASLIVAFPGFLRWFFLVVGAIAAVNVVVNIVLFFGDIDSAAYASFTDIRLVASVGMPGYGNSTNIGATYAVLLTGMLATTQGARASRPSRLQYVVLWLSSSALLAGVVLTQARSAWLAVVAGVLVLAFASGRRTGWVSVAVVGLLTIAAFAEPQMREALLVRGDSFRIDVWRQFLGLIAQRPWLGYGSFSPVGVVVAKYYFLDQAHNLVLSAWFRGGLISAAALAYVLAAGTYWCWRFWRQTGEVVPLCVMATVATAGMFDYQLLVTYPTWPWVTFWLPFGLCIGAEMAWRINARSGVVQASGARDVAQFSAGNTSLATASLPKTDR